MAYIPGSSFIPKETTVGATPKVVKRKRTFHIIGFIASVLLVLSLLTALGTFGYRKYLEGRLLTVQSELTQKKSEDMESRLKEIAIFDRQINIAKYLLDNHIAPTRIFTALESLTKETVVYSSFDYAYDPGNIAQLDVTGGTEELTSVAVQKIEFTAKDLFDEFTVKDITFGLAEAVDGAPAQESDEAVAFSIEGSLDKDVIEYTGEREPSSAPSLIPETSPSEDPNTI